MPDPVVIDSDIASAVLMSAQKKYVKTKLKIGWKPRALLALAESNKEGHNPSGKDGEIIESAQLVPELISQYWRGLDTIMDAQTPHGSIQFAQQYCRHVLPIKMGHDEWLQRGYVFRAHVAGGDWATRVKAAGEKSLQKLSDDLIKYTLDGVNKAFDDLHDLGLHKQGASYKEPVGLNAMLPIAPIGNVYGHDRGVTPEVQHLVLGSAIGASGTLVSDLEGMFRELGVRNANNGLGSEMICIAGGDWIQGYKDEARKDGRVDLDAGGTVKLDAVILDRAIRVGGMDVIHDVTLDEMNVKAVSEMGLAISPNAVTFSGGGATRQATGYAVVSSGGVITNIVVTDPGAGYTSQPTCAVATVAGETLTCSFYGTGGALTGKVVVADDDMRAGKLAGVVVTGGGTGGTAGDAPLFSKRAYFIPRKALAYKIAAGIERQVTHPADSRSVRSSESQLETVFYWYNRYLRGCALSYIK